MQFRDVIGQEEVKNRLRHAFHEGRLAHAILLLGPEGSGQLALALAFAQFVSCPNRTETDSCGQCPTCQKMGHLQHADMNFTFPFFNKGEGGDKKTTCDDWMTEFRELVQQDPYSSLEDWKGAITKDNKQLIVSVYEASRIINRLSLRSYEGGYKFQFIWMAEFLKTDTANKLLKILEEPPAGTIFLLVAESIENILATILSRVQTIYVPRIEDEVIKARLESKGIDSNHASKIAHFSHGNWNKAWLLAQSKDPDLDYAASFQEWMRMCFKKNAPWLIQWSSSMHEKPREEQKHFLNYALDQIRQNLLYNYAGEQIVRMNDSELAFSKKFSPFINDLNAEDLMHELNEAHTDVSRNAYSKMVFTDLSFRIHYLLNRKN